MRAHFLGGAGEVGRLGCVIEHTGGSVLIDYGIAPKKPPEWPMMPPPVDGMLLTHAHLDHSGMIPALTARQDVDVRCADVTRRMSSILFHDTIKIADQDGHARPFEPFMAEDALTRFVGFERDETETLGGFEVTARSAGHIPGAHQYVLTGNSKTVAFTGDLYLNETRLVPAADQVKADVLFVESTYAGRRHPDRASEERRLVESVRTTVESGGTALVAAFATGRTQEVLLSLAAKLDYEMWLDGMGGRVLDIMLDHPKTLADHRALKAARSKIRIVRSSPQRRRALNTGQVIIATSGMLDGGPILYYLNALRRDTRCRLMLTGYQVRGTNGRRLLESGTIHDRGMPTKIDIPVDNYDLSTHLDHPEIVQYVRKSGCEDVVLYHGDNREALVADLEPHARVHLPDTNDQMTFP